MRFNNQHMLATKLIQTRYVKMKPSIQKENGFVFPYPSNCNHPTFVTFAILDHKHSQQLLKMKTISLPTYISLLNDLYIQKDSMKIE